MFLESEIRVLLANFGEKLQQKPGSSRIKRFVGRSLLSASEPYVKIVRSKDTGAIVRILPKGDVEG